MVVDISMLRCCLFESFFAFIFRDCFQSSIFLMFVFTLISFIPFIFEIGSNNFHNSPLENAIHSSDYKQWLLVSIIIAIPKILSNSLKLKRNDSTMSLICKMLPVLSILLPNVILYSIISTSDKYGCIPQLWNSIFYSQTMVIIASIFCGTFGHKYRSLPSHNPFDTRVDRYTVCFLLSFTVYRFLLLLSSIIYEDVLRKIFLAASSLFLIVGMLQMIYVVSRMVYYLWHQMEDGKFREYYQMHDFYRVLAILWYACYTFAIYARSNQLVSDAAAYELTSKDLTAFLFGVIILTIFLEVIEPQCYIREVELKEQQLQNRLNLTRYISHEMRSPLNSAFMGLQLLRKDIQGSLVAAREGLGVVRKAARSSNLDTTVKEKIQTALKSTITQGEELLSTCALVQESASVALETLNDMLTFDKMDENKLVLEPEDLNVWNFVNDTVRPFRINAMKAQVSLVLECVDLEAQWPATCSIKADRFKLTQVLRNFLSNALKFCANPQGEVKLLVERRSVPERAVRPITTATNVETGTPTSSPNHLQAVPAGPVSAPVMINSVVRVSVRDNGCGISLENQKKLFGQYVQFDAKKLQKGGGSGLGLWISKNLVEMHGGSVGVSSVEGCGATFYFELPLFEKDPSPPSIFEYENAQQISNTDALSVPCLRQTISMESDLCNQPSPSSSPRAIHRLQSTLPPASSSLIELADCTEMDIEAQSFSMPRPRSSRNLGGSLSTSASRPSSASISASAQAAAARTWSLILSSFRFNSNPSSVYAAPGAGAGSGSMGGSGNGGGDGFLDGSQEGLPLPVGEDSFCTPPPHRDSRITTANTTSHASVGHPSIPHQKSRGSFIEARRQSAVRHVDRLELSSITDHDAKHSETASEPRPQGQIQQQPQQQPQQIVRPQSRSGKRTLRFLIVDDTMPTRKVMKRLLTDMGHSVDEAADGLLCLRKLGIASQTSGNLLQENSSQSAATNIESFDVILMDDSMPHLTGPEATAAIRAAGYKGLIFGVTGNSYSDQVEFFKAQGADMVFSKPMDMRELEKAVQQRIKKSELEK